MLSSRKWIWFGVVISVLLGSAALKPEAASACSCAIVSNVQEAKQSSDAVFDGTVIGKKTASKLFASSSADPVTWTFQVNEVWKGKVAPVLSVTSAESGDSCGYEFREGQRYVVYARKTGETLDVSLCSRTALYSAAGQDLADLGVGSVPPQQPAAAADSQSGFLLWWLLLLAAAAVLAAMIYYKRRSKKQTF
ncbi:hypothetical protein D3P08_14805 [Paenibacillus nanensis]|uniref:Tissue inhibitor of metalloproteinase n=2 Tax=Paenibacillus nanensis TaxID=393251 RepID=A0A3A1UWX6_9BACL|nr:hypothetical protein D3P08_14805 [Paenibacillus nanensis]